MKRGLEIPWESPKHDRDTRGRCCWENGTKDSLTAGSPRTFSLQTVRHVCGAAKPGELELRCWFLSLWTWVLRLLPGSLSVDITVYLVAQIVVGFAPSSALPACCSCASSAPSLSAPQDSPDPLGAFPATVAVPPEWSPGPPWRVGSGSPGPSCCSCRLRSGGRANSWSSLWPFPSDTDDDHVLGKGILFGKSKHAQLLRGGAEGRGSPRCVQSAVCVVPYRVFTFAVPVQIQKACCVTEAMSVFLNS